MGSGGVARPLICPGITAMEQCSFPRCKRYADLGYIGIEVCREHWAELCDADSKTEKRLLKKVGLKRSSEGAVVPIRTQEEQQE